MGRQRKLLTDPQAVKRAEGFPSSRHGEAAEGTWGCLPGVLRGEEAGLAARSHAGNDIPILAYNLKTLLGDS